jgi:anti-sigma-K factor RskA
LTPVVERDDVHELAAAYVLNALDDEERRVFEAHLGRCTVCEEELASLRQAAAALAYAAAGPPPAPDLRARVLAEAGGARERASVVPLRRRLRPYVFPALGGLAVAAAAAAVVLALWASSLSDRLDDERSARGELADLVAGVARGDLARLPLHGAGGAAFVNRSGGAVLVVSGVRAAPSGRAYEIWIVEGTKATPAGLFGGGRTAVVPLLAPVAKGDRIGVTLERARGAEMPSGPLLFETARSA